MTFGTGVIVILVLVAVLAVYGIILYNRLVKYRQMTEEGWSGIDVQLKRRANLVPNLIEAVKGYMTHERETLEEVVKLRNAATSAGDDVAGRAKAESALSGMLGRLFALAENYPDLKASQNFLDFQNGLEEIEDEIQLSRRYYNGAARNLNVAVESFPSNLVAAQFKFEQAEYFEIADPGERAVPQVSFSG